MAGVEALPVLHRTCRGYLARDLPSRVILYSGACSASRKLRDYLVKVLDEGQGGEAGGVRVGGARRWSTRQVLYIITVSQIISILLRPRTRHPHTKVCVLA